MGNLFSSDSYVVNYNAYTSWIRQGYAMDSWGWDKGFTHKNEILDVPGRNVAYCEVSGYHSMSTVHDHQKVNYTCGVCWPRKMILSNICILNENKYHCTYPFFFFLLKLVMVNPLRENYRW